MKERPLNEIERVVHEKYIFSNELESLLDLITFVDTCIF